MPRTFSAHLPSRRLRTTIALLAAISLVATAFAGGTAEASRVVYSCAPDLCAIDPESGATSAITTDGSAGPYEYPSISRDGSRLAAARGNVVVAGPYGSNLAEQWGGTRDINDVAIRPDGAGVGESHSYVENRYGCPLTGGCLELVDRSATFYTSSPPPAETTAAHRGGGGVGFIGAGTLLSSFYTIADDLHTICVVADPADGNAICEPRVSSSMTLSAPAGSPDGKLIAAAVSGPAPSGASSINLYDAGTGTLVRPLAAGTDPAFSPDGSEVAFGGPDGWIYAIPTKGGEPRRLVKGISPTWGGGTGPGPAVASKSLRYRKGRIAVKVRCSGTTACRGSLRITKGKATLGGRSYKVRAGRSATVSVKPSGSAQRQLEGSGQRQVVVQLKPKKGWWATKKVTLRY